MGEQVYSVWANYTTWMIASSPNVFGYDPETMPDLPNGDAPVRGPRRRPPPATASGSASSRSLLDYCPEVTVGEKIGWIGLGQIGTPMATRLLGTPGGLVVCDIVEEATRTFAAEGAEVAADPAGVVAAGATVISVMVRDDAQVRAVVDQIVAVAPPGTLVAVHSTIRPETAEELAATAAEAGVVILDAPVSGGVAGASTGRLALLLGGDEAAVERCRAVYAPLADLVVHFGPAGAGTRAKIARNVVGFAGYVAVDEAMRLAEALGLDLKGLGQVIRHSDAVTGGAGAVALRSETGRCPRTTGSAPSSGTAPPWGRRTSTWRSAWPPRRASTCRWRPPPATGWRPRWASPTRRASRCSACASTCGWATSTPAPPTPPPWTWSSGPRRRWHRSWSCPSTTASRAATCRRRGRWRRRWRPGRRRPSSWWRPPCCRSTTRSAWPRRSP